MPGKFTDETIMPLGEHQGKKLANVPASYLLWLHDQTWLKGPLKEYILENFETLRMEIQNEKK